MRIIAGIHRSRLLKMVPSEETKETSDKVRGAIFNSLSDAIIDTVVLDLFAGSGAYGLESISRGASICMFNDSKLDAYKTILENVHDLKVEKQSILWQLDYLKAIKKIKDEDIKFDIIFLDPPYKMDVYESVINELSTQLNTGGIVVAEMHKDRIIDMNIITELNLTHEKIYGIKKVNYFSKK